MSTSFSRCLPCLNRTFESASYYEDGPQAVTPAGPFETADEAVDEFLSFTLGWATNPADPPPEPEKVAGHLLGMSAVVYQRNPGRRA